MSKSDSELEIAVAAAAYAITSREQQGSMGNQKRITAEEQEGPLAKTTSRREDSMTKTTERNVSRWLTRKDAKEDAKLSGSSSTAEEPSTLGKKLLEEFGAGLKLPGKQMEIPVTIKKAATFSDKYLTGTGDVRDQRGQAEQQARSPWTKAKLQDVQKRYDKFLASLLKWEKQKKDKARRRKERIERKLKLRQERASKEYVDELSMIDKTVRGARILADAHKRNDEAKVLERAKKQQSDGGAHKHSCSCL